jgi:hypothetical protein
LKSTTSRSSEHNVASFDPVNLPVDAVAGESALEAARLNADWLRQRFADPPRWEPEHSGDQMARWPSQGRFRLASVLIPLVLREGLTVLLTQRTAHLKDHAGQISFPGGRAKTMTARPSTPPCARPKKKSAWRASTSKSSARCRITSPAPVIASRRWPA